MWYVGRTDEARLMRDLAARVKYLEDKAHTHPPLLKPVYRTRIDLITVHERTGKPYNWVGVPSTTPFPPVTPGGHTAVAEVHYRSDGTVDHVTRRG